MERNVYLNPASVFNGCINKDIALPIVRGPSMASLFLAGVVASFLCAGVMVVWIVL